MKFYHMSLIGIPNYSSYGADQTRDYLYELSKFLNNKGVKNGRIFLFRHSSQTDSSVTLRFFYDQDRDQAAKALNLSDFLGHKITTFILAPQMDERISSLDTDYSF